MRLAVDLGLQSWLVPLVVLQGTFAELVSRPNSLLSAVVATYESEAKDAYEEAKVLLD